jgi:hypothetical protein
VDLRQVRNVRQWIGRLGMLAGAVALIGVIDGLAASLRTPANLVEALPGQTVPVDGPLAQDINSAQELTAITDSPLLKVTVDEVHRGYFLGGARWRGSLTVSPEAKPGKYAFTVEAKARGAANPELAFRVDLYPDAASIRQVSRSMITQALGISPYFVAALAAPWIFASFGLVFWLSRRCESLLHQLGQAEIYQVRQGEGEYLVAFALGTQDGVRPGDRLQILDDEGQTIGSVEVTEATATDAQGSAQADRPLMPGCLVSKERKG